MAVGNQPAHPAYQKLGDTNVAAHRRILEAARRGDANRVRKLMAEHIDEAWSHVHELRGAVRQRFVTDADLRHRPSLPQRKKP